VRAPSEEQRDGFGLLARERSGSEDWIEYPVTVAGISIALCQLSLEHWREFQDDVYKGNGRNARAKAIARARLWPTQQEVADACAATPALADRLVGVIERLHGAGSEYLTVIEADGALDASAIAAMGIDPTVVAELRRRYPHQQQLHLAAYRDEELDIAWSCVLKLPDDHAHDTVKSSLRERGYEAVATYAANALAYPGGADAGTFLAANPGAAARLMPSLYAWGETAAAARPIVSRRRLRASATLNAPQASSAKSSPTSASDAPTRPDRQGSSSPGSS